MIEREPGDPELVRIGFGHASLIGSLRPDLAYRERKVKRGEMVHTTITAEPCDCADELGHVEIWASWPEKMARQRSLLDED